MPDFDFEPKITYSLKDALALALASALAYADEGEISDAAAEWGLPKCSFISREGTQVFVAANADIVVVAFRGTEPGEREDWLTDVNFPTLPGPAGEVHRGFLAALNSVWIDVHEGIRSLCDRKQGVWLTGHSLGAALATLAAARLELQQRDPIGGLYTFGSPRVGDGEFRRAADSRFLPRSFRFVNHNDIVTRLPPRAFGFQHAGNVRYFDSDGKLREDQSWWDRFEAALPVGDLVSEALDKGPDETRKVVSGLLNEYVRHHSIDRYIELLRRAQGETADRWPRLTGVFDRLQERRLRQS